MASLNATILRQPECRRLYEEAAKAYDAARFVKRGAGTRIHRPTAAESAALPLLAAVDQSGMARQYIEWRGNWLRQRKQTNLLREKCSLKL